MCVYIHIHIYVYGHTGAEMYIDHLPSRSTFSLWTSYYPVDKPKEGAELGDPTPNALH